MLREYIKNESVRGYSYQTIAAAWIKFGFSDNDTALRSYFTRNPLICRDDDPPNMRPNVWFAKIGDGSRGLDTELKNILLERHEQSRDISEWISPPQRSNASKYF